MTDAGAAPAPPPDDRPTIRIEGLHKAFGDNVVLRGIDLDVACREVVCVIGPSGSGKSTLLRCINRLEEPTAGRVVVDGVEVTAPGVDLDKVRTSMGMVFQQFNLFPHKSALGNITLALCTVLKMSKGEAEKRGRDLLERVGLAGKEAAYPARLSGGQQQRVAIARAVIGDPTLIVADEPTGDLDRTSAAEILAMMKRLNEELGKTIIMVTHDAHAAEKARALVHLEKGELIEG